MEWLWISIGAILILSGILGCILPVLPGPPIGFLGLLVLQLSPFPPFTERELVMWGLLAALVTFLDYVVPVWGTKKFGGSKKGVWGSIIGLIFGLTFPPFGIIIGPFIGAVLGEMLDGKDFSPALKAGFGSFLGFLAGTLMKLAVSLYFSYQFVVASYKLLA